MQDRAVAGARKHQVPVEVVQAAQERKAQAKQVHETMVSILKARFAAEEDGLIGVDATDRGWEADTCTQFLDDELDGECFQSVAH